MDSLFAYIRSPKTVIEWNSGDRSQVIIWSTTPLSDGVYHTVRLQNPVVFNEFSNMAEWGSFYYAMQSVSSNGVIYISSLIASDLGK